MTDWQSWSRSPVRRGRAHLEAATSTCTTTCTSGSQGVGYTYVAGGGPQTYRVCHIRAPLSSTGARVRHCYEMVTLAAPPVPGSSLWPPRGGKMPRSSRSEEHTSELQSLRHLVC